LHTLLFAATGSTRPGAVIPLRLVSDNPPR
jgi:hypothetical protein